MSERSKEHASKACEGEPLREFESRLIRHQGFGISQNPFSLSKFCIRCRKAMSSFMTRILCDNPGTADRRPVLDSLLKDCVVGDGVAELEGLIGVPGHKIRQHGGAIDIGARIGVRLRPGAIHFDNRHCGQCHA